MAVRYSSADLLKLRDSPLVAKPTSLPPAEEWMGSNARADSQSRPHGVTAPASGFSLKPPKTSFSSTFKGANGPFESPARSAIGNFGGKTDHHESRRGERDGAEGGEDRPATGRGARQRRGDSSSWGTGLDDDEKAPRRGGGRDGDHEPGDERDSRRQRGYDLQRKDGGREGDGTRRNGAGAASRPSWLRGDDEPAEPRSREGLRSGDWRDGDRGQRRGQDRTWNRTVTSPDVEPEWMAADSQEDKKGRTVQDMEQWKASMKAKEKQATATESPADSTTHSRTASSTLAAKMKMETPLMLDPSIDDKFFGIMNESSAGMGPKKAEGNAAAAKPAAKASKFSGFFGPQTPANLSESGFAPPPPVSFPVVDSANDDKAGFQRILAMLAAPHGSSGAPPNAPPQQPQGNTPPGEKATLHPTRSPPPIISPRSRRPGALENLLGMQSPPEGHVQPHPPNHPAHHQPNVPTNKDADFLLNLLRSRDGEAQMPLNMPNRMPQHFHGGPPQGLGEEPHPAGSGGNGMYDDFAGPPRHGPGEQLSNHPSNRLPPQQQHFDDKEDHERGNYPPPFPPMGHPPGLQRPPGFENMPPPPPGFPQYMQPPRPGGMPPGPPPGFGGRPPNQFPPGLIPGMGNMNLGNERGGGPPYGGPGVPGGMRGPPPPGFMNSPPPGFPPMGGGPPPPPDGFPGGHPPPPPPPGRMMDMFGDQYGGGRGGPPPPPLQGQFRRD